MIKEEIVLAFIRLINMLPIRPGQVLIVFLKRAAVDAKGTVEE